MIKRLLKNITWIILIVISIILTGIAELIVVGFDLTDLKEAKFWFNLGVTTFSAFIMALSSCEIQTDLISNNLSEDSLGKKANDLRQCLNFSTAKIHNDIDMFLVEENLSRKKEAWVYKINKKMIKIDHFFKMEDSLQFAEYVKTGKVDKKYSKRVLKKIKLDKKLDETFINGNILYLRVKFQKITRKMIESGEIGNLEHQETLSKKSLVIIRGLVPKFLLSISLSVFMASFLFDKADNYSWTIIIPIMTKLLTLILNANFGKNFATEYFKNTTLHDLLLRNEWIMKYFEWQKEKAHLNNELNTDKQ